LEKLSASEIVAKSKVYGKFGSYPEPLESLKKTNEDALPLAERNTIERF
jgi:hypothetical protein